MTFDSTGDTKAHIFKVGELLGEIVRKLLFRAQYHDASKLEEPEKSMYDTFTPLLRESTYGSDEYQKYLREMGPALAHHYENNSHHPEYYPIRTEREINEIRARLDKMEDDDPARVWLASYLAERQSRVNGMSLLDVVEMLADWKAAGTRHANGDIWKSLEINKKRFGLSDQLFEILKNTVSELEW